MIAFTKLPCINDCAQTFLHKKIRPCTDKNKKSKIKKMSKLTVSDRKSKLILLKMKTLTGGRVPEDRLKSKVY